MADITIIENSPVGRHLDSIGETKPASYLMFNHKKVELVTKITIGRDSDNDVVVDNKLASRHHAVIQKIKDQYFIDFPDTKLMQNKETVNGKTHNRPCFMLFWIKQQDYTG